MDEGPRDERRSGTSRVLSRVVKGGGGESLSDAAALNEKPAAPPPRRVLNAEEFEARSTAKDIIARAHEEAERIKVEALRFKEEVFARAREEAKADVQARAAEELARAKMQAGQVLADSERDLLALALEIARKIIGRDLERDPDLVMEIIAGCTEAARASKAMVLRVNPEDGKLLREKKPKLMELIGRSVDLSIRDDTEIERGGCVIQTEYGVIDGQIRTQFEMLRNVLQPTEARKEVK